MKCYVVKVTGDDCGIDITPSILNDKVFTNRGLANVEAECEAKAFVKDCVGAQVCEETMGWHVRTGAFTRFFEIEELELVEE